MTTRATWPLGLPLVASLAIILLLTGPTSCQLNQPRLPGLAGQPGQSGLSVPSDPSNNLSDPTDPSAPPPTPTTDQGDNPLPASRDALLTRHYNQILALNTIADQPRDLNQLRAGYRRLLAERGRCTDRSCLETLNRQLGEEICAYYPFMGDSDRCRQDFAATGDEALDQDLTATIGADLAAGKYNSSGWLKIDPNLTYDAAGEDLYAWLLFHNAAFASLVDRHGVPDYLKPLADPEIRLYALYGDARKIVELTTDPTRETLWDLRFPPTVITSDPGVRDTAAFYRLINQADESFSFPSAILDQILPGPGLTVISSARHERRAAATVQPLANNPPAATLQPEASNLPAAIPPLQPSATSASIPSTAQGTAPAPPPDSLHVAALVRNNGAETVKGFTLTCTSRDAQGERLQQRQHREKRELLPGEMALIEFPFPSPTPPQALECQIGLSMVTSQDRDGA